LSHLFQSKSNRDYLRLAKQNHLNVYLNDFLTRLNYSKVKRTFAEHFPLSTTIIYPLTGIDQILADDLHVHVHVPLESLLPILSCNIHSSYKLHEQIRSKCYFVPLTNCKIEINDDEYQRQTQELDRTHVVITLETKSQVNRDECRPIRTKKPSIELEPSCLLISDDSFRTGSIRVDQNKLPKHYSSFVIQSIEDNHSYLSSTLIQHWFQTLVLVNQTCAIAKRFLQGDGSHITCLLKQHIK
jgi:hypothetical protein